MDLLKELNKQVKEGQARWEEINSLSEKLNSLLAADTLNSEEAIRSMANILNLILAQLRPMQSSLKQAENLQEDITNIFSSLANLGKK